jgi:tRNA (mo5U34)-methyltransferase
MDLQTAQERVAARPWWYHKFEIFPGVVTPGVYDPSGTLSMLRLPDDMRGTSVLEIGPADGFFTKALAARGADVTAVDYTPKDYHGFALMEEASGTTFNYRQANIYDLPKLGLGTFDIVLCLGVLYHLPDLMRGLWTLRQCVKDLLILETFISREHEDQPFARYLPTDSQNGDNTNFWAPNPLCCDVMLRDCGFSVENVWLNDTRGMFHCRLDHSPGALVKMAAAYEAPSW